MRERFYKYLLLVLLFPGIALADELTVTVKGMVCSFCAQGIKKAFQSMPEIESVQVDLEHKFVRLKTKADKKLSEETITKIINDAGYDVLGIEKKS